MTIVRDCVREGVLAFSFRHCWGGNCHHRDKSEKCADKALARNSMTAVASAVGYVRACGSIYAQHLGWYALLVTVISDCTALDVIDLQYDWILAQLVSLSVLTLAVGDHHVFARIDPWTHGTDPDISVASRITSTMFARTSSLLDANFGENRLTFRWQLLEEELPPFKGSSPDNFCIFRSSWEGFSEVCLYSRE